MPEWCHPSLGPLTAYLADWQRRESCFHLILILNLRGEFGVNLWCSLIFSGKFWRASCSRQVFMWKVRCWGSGDSVEPTHFFTILQFCQEAWPLRGTREWLIKQCAAFFLYNVKMCVKNSTTNHFLIGKKAQSAFHCIIIIIIIIFKISHFLET